MSTKSKITRTIRYFAAFVLACAYVNGAWAGKTAAALVTTNGVTTPYLTLTNAWTDACAAQRMGVNTTIKLLKDATVDTPLETGYNAALTLDLNDCVLGYAGKLEGCIVQQGGGTLHVVDTSATRTPRYFACDPETGLWTLTNEVTDLTVSGGTLTGGRRGAIFWNCRKVGDGIAVF